MNKLDRILAALEGRVASNLKTAQIHPDELSRAQAKLRAEAYANALNDVERIVKDL